MKVKIKKTGEIINAASYARIALDKCDSYGNPIELPIDEVEFVTYGELTDLEKIDILTDVMKYHSNIMTALETRISQLSIRITELESRINI